MKSVLRTVGLGFAALVLTACAGMPSDGVPTTTPAPAGWGTPEPASETHRLDLSPGVVVAFVEGLTPEMSEKVAYVTHVPSGSQAIVDGDGKVVQRHDGRLNGRVRLDAVLNDGDAMARILAGLTNGADARPQPHAISWVPMVKFDGIHYLRRWYHVGQFTRADISDLTREHLGSELYRVAFRGDGYAGPWYRYQDGDATFLNPGTPVYAVQGYSPKFRLATLDQGRLTLYEADTNPFAKTGQDLLDIRDKVAAIDILEDYDENTLLATIDDHPTVARFVDLALAAPVNQNDRDRRGPRYFLRLRLADGTSVVRVFRPETGELSRGVMTDPEAAYIVSDALRNRRAPDQATTTLYPSPDSPTNNEPGPAMVFPRHDAPLGTDRGEEYFAAQLVLREGCLRAEVLPKYDPNDPGSWLIIWPNGFTFETEAETVRVVDELGRVVAQVGDYVRLSRAAFTFPEAAERELVRGLSKDCTEPYFLVGDEVSAFDPGSEATELRLSEPDVVFFRQRTTVARYQTMMMAAGVGELILDGQCLRLKDGSPREYWPTIIWPAGFTPHVNEGVVEIRNGAGRVMAQVGDQIAGGGGFFDRSSGDCSGPIWQANDMKTLPDVEVYFPKQDGTLAPEEGTELFSGKLILWGKCLQVSDDVIRVKDRVYAGISPLIIWPHDFALSMQDGVVGIVDGTGSVVARVGDEVEFDAFNLTYEEAREHGGLAEITPACSGPYWAVGEAFAAVPDL